MGTMEELNKSESDNSKLPIGIALGVSIGTAVGVSTSNIGLWLPIGVAIGASLGVGLNTAAKQEGSNEESGSNETSM